MQNSKNILLALLVSSVLTNHAAATLVSQVDIVFGTGAITFDSATGLSWLDLTKSTDLSFNYVTSQLVLGGQFYGFRYATNSEISTLWVDAGINISKVTNGHLFPDPANIAPIVALQNLIGVTISSTSQNTSQGISGTIFSGPYPNLLPFIISDGMTAPMCCEENLPSWNGGVHNPGVGSWLVVGAPSTEPTSVPEPGTLGLLGFAIAGLGFTNRKLFP